jgi:hypothetical protein
MLPNEPNLDQLFERYAQACPDVEPGANFMPAIWQRIDARRGFSFKLASYARILAMSAASLCLAAGLFEISAYGPANSSRPVRSSTFSTTTTTPRQLSTVWRRCPINLR